MNAALVGGIGHVFDAGVGSLQADLIAAAAGSRGVTDFADGRFKIIAGGESAMIPPEVAVGSVVDMRKQVADAPDVTSLNGEHHQLWQSLPVAHSITDKL